MSTTEIATRVDAQVASIIQTAAQDLSDAHKIGTALASTSFVPQHFKGKPEEAAAAILYGATIDMDPLTALQNIYVISGKPALYARSMVAVVMSKGHNIWTEEEIPGSVTVCGRRQGSDQVERVTWTTEMAKTAGYTSNKKYQSDSRAMLYARASGDVARRIAPDALLGMAYSREELEMSPSYQADPQPASRLQAAVAAKVAETAAPAPEPETVDVTDAVEMISERQMKALHAQFGEAGITEREDKLASCSSILKRDVDSTKDLTAEEAKTVYEYLRKQS